jgi:hypothetical protein
MPFDWSDYLTLAQRLAGVANDASKRTAISRVYYFVFNIAFARAQATTGQRPLGETFHKWCWDKYRNSPDPRCMKIGLAGERMSRRRVKADYEPADIDRLDDQVQLMLVEAQQFRADLAALDPRYPLP